MKKHYFFALLLLAVLPFAAMAQSRQKAKANATFRAGAPTEGFCWGNRYVDMNSGEQKYQGVKPPAALAFFIESPTLLSDHTLNSVSFSWGGASDDHGQILVLNQEKELIFVENISIQPGWNTYPLASPYTLASGKYYIGVFGHTTNALPYVIPFDGSPYLNVEEGCWVGVEDDETTASLSVGKSMSRIENWSGYGPIGTLNLVADIEGQETSNCALICNLQAPYEGNAGSEVDCSILIRNVGTKAIESAELQFDLAGKTQVATIHDVPVGAEKLFILPYTLPASGVNLVVKVHIAKVNDLPNTLAYKSQNFTVNVKSSTKPMKVKDVLLEEFTSEKCVGCPRAKPIVEYIKEDLESKGYRVSVIAHHAGFALDDFTLQQSLELEPYLYKGGSFAPAILLNRLAVGKNDACASNVEMMKKNFQTYLDNSYQYGDFDGMTFNDSGITLSGRLLSMVDKEQVYLHVCICENQVKPISQSNAPEGYMHDALVRKFIFPIQGGHLTLDQDYHFSMTIPTQDLSGYNKANLYAVAFLTGPLGEPQTSFDSRYVYASTNAQFSGKGMAIKAVNQSKPILKVEGGKMVVFGAYISCEIYNLSGQLVSRTLDCSLPSGLYVVKLSDARGSYIYKVRV